MDLIRALFNVDPLTIFMVVGLCVIWAIVGFQICKARHRQHGLAVDKDFKVPDLLPPSWDKDPAGV